ncbi:MAG TPA: PorP/SprF family type IX secretion system membrane protein [Cyclobacteriaceae bacterium]|nr:PorP/SprF family type IX secretion system membrane protein [Cyclobacteriaceae bacterium]
MRITIPFLFLVTICETTYGQYFHFSQINYTDQRINPAAVAISDYATLNFVHRNQKTGGDFNLNSSYVSAAYPFLSKRDGHRWSGIGISVLDDRSGGIFKTQEAALSFAINVPLSRWQTLTLGTKGLYQQRRINLDGVYTGMQYIPDRGFDEGAFSGEDFQQLQNSFFTFSMGGYWQMTDKAKNRVSYLSFSFFDFNKPKDSFLGNESKLRGALVGAFGFRVYKKGPLSIFPELLYTHTYANHVMNFGAIWQYELASSAQSESSHIDFITKYVIGRSGIFGIQLHKENFSIGFSYDFPIAIENPGNTGAFEIGVQLRRLVDAKLKAKAARKDKPTASLSAKNKTPARDSIEQPVVKNESIKKAEKSVSLKESLQMKQDSVVAQAQAGGIQHEPVELEKATLRFNFDFNSSTINEDSGQYLNELAEVLKENHYLQLNLTGHTDNIGSDKFNLRLSKERAQAVKDYLTDRGVEPERISVSGKGMREPLNSNLNDDERAVNRRVELIIIYQPVY